MTGGLIQLVAVGIEDIYLTRDPQITLFKIVYRRHTNFSTQAIKQKFVTPPDFGKKTSYILSRSNGDLIGKTYLVITLPKIKITTRVGADTELAKLIEFAWVRKIGFAIVKTVEIEIGGQLVDRQYGEWLNIWAELTEKKTNGYLKMIGETSELIDFTHEKDEYTLYVPLQFWFCRSYSLALPVVSLEYSDIKINLEMNDLDECYVTNPTHYQVIENDVVNFQKYEYIEQNIDGIITSGQFLYYDNLTKRIYYRRISRNNFQSMVIDELAVTPLDRRSLVYSDTNSKYWIRGLSSFEFAMPKFNSTPVAFNLFNDRLITLKDCYLLVDYVFLDQEERTKFVDSRHDYLIEQIQTINEKTIDSSNKTFRVEGIHPTKLMVWIVQYSYLRDKNNNDTFNYTDSYKYDDNKLLGNSLVKKETIIMNGQERLSERDYNYFNYIQPYQYFPKFVNEGINIYSLSLLPTEIYPSGTCNLTQIDNLEYKLNMNSNINITNQAVFRGYIMNYNIYRIVNGLGGLVFVR
jgi:hypothetical protein